MANGPSKPPDNLNVKELNQMAEHLKHSGLSQGQQEALYNRYAGMANQSVGGAYGNSLGGGGGVFGQPAYGQIHQASHEDMLRDLMARASRNAFGTMGTSPRMLPATMTEHREFVKKLLQDFLDGSEYLQAQITMIESAFKDRPQLIERLTLCINRAYGELCAETFGAPPARGIP